MTELKLYIWRAFPGTWIWEIAPAGPKSIDEVLTKDVVASAFVDSWGQALALGLAQLEIRRVRP